MRGKRTGSTSMVSTAPSMMVFAQHASKAVFMHAWAWSTCIWSPKVTQAPNDRADTFGYRSLQDIVVRKGIVVPRFENLPKETIINGTKIEILYPPDDFRQRKARQRWRTSNNNSLVLKLTSTSSRQPVIKHATPGGGGASPQSHHFRGLAQSFRISASNRC